MVNKVNTTANIIKYIAFKSVLYTLARYSIQLRLYTQLYHNNLSTFEKPSATLLFLYYRLCYP